MNRIRKTTTVRARRANRNLGGARRPAALAVAAIFALAAALLLAACGGSQSLFVPTGAGSGGGATPTGAAPAITSLNPANATAGAAALSLVITGSGFASSSVVTWGTTTLAPTAAAQTATQLTVSVPASMLAAGGTFSVVVTNPANAGGASSPATFTVNNPAPTAGSLNPSQTAAGGAALTLQINGANFDSASAVTWGSGASAPALSITAQTATQLTVTVPANLLAAAGSFPVDVTNPGPGGGTASLNLQVTNSAPTVSGLSQTSAAAGGAAFTLVVTGSGFNSTSVVNWGGGSSPTALTPTSSGQTATQLSVTVPANLIASGGQFPIVVNNPAPGGGASTPVTFTVTNPAPTLASASPNSLPAGSQGGTVLLTGAGFNASTQVTWGSGTPPTTLAITQQSATQLTVTLPASLLANAGQDAITVANPAVGGQGGGQASLSPLFNIAPSIASLSPGYATTGTGPLTLQINGAGFITPGSWVTFNGTTLQPTGAAPTATQLNVTVPASLLAAAGANSVVVNNPAAQGGPSPAFTFQVTNPGPQILGISPATVNPGYASPLSVTITGTGFIQASSVSFNGAVVPSSSFNYISPTQIVLTLTPSQMATPGAFPITVTNAGTPPAGTSNAFYFSVGAGTGESGIAVVPEEVAGQTVDVAYLPIPRQTNGGVQILPAQVAVVQLDALDPRPFLPINGMVTPQEDVPYDLLPNKFGTNFYNPNASTQNDSTDYSFAQRGSAVLERITTASGGLPAGFNPSVTVWDQADNQVLVGDESSNQVLVIKLTASPGQTAGAPTQVVSSTYTVGTPGNLSFSGDDDCQGICDIVVDNTGISGHNIAVATLPGAMVRFNALDGSAQTTIAGETTPGEQFGYTSNSKVWNVINPWYQPNGTHGLQYIDLNSNTVQTLTNPVGDRPDSAAVDPLTQLAVIPDEGSGANYLLNFYFLAGATAPANSVVPMSSFTIGAAGQSVYCANRYDWTLTAIDPITHALFSAQENTACIAGTQLPSSPVLDGSGNPTVPPVPSPSSYGRMTAPQGSVASQGYQFAPPWGDVSIPGLDPDAQSWNTVGDPHQFATFTSTLSGQPNAILPEAPGAGCSGYTGGLWLAETNLNSLLAAPSTLTSDVTNGEVNPTGMAQLVTYLRIVTPSPCISVPSPNSFSAGSTTAQALTITGGGFVAGSVVELVCPSPYTSLFLSPGQLVSETPTQITVDINPSELAEPISPATSYKCSLTITNDGVTTNGSSPSGGGTATLGGGITVTQ